MHVFDKGWNVDNVLNYLRTDCPNVEQDNDGQIILYTDLWQWDDGSLHTEPQSD